MEEHTVHEVCNALKRFLRNLHDPLLTDHLYGQWIATAGKYSFYSLGIENSECVFFLCVCARVCLFVQSTLFDNIHRHTASFKI